MGNHLFMHKKAKRKSRAKAKRRLNPVQLPAFGDELLLYRTRHHAKKSRQKDSERTKYLLGKVGTGLNLPGIKPTVVFKSKDVFAYSIDPTNPNRIVRHSSAGKRTVGRLVDGRFKAI